MSDTSASAETRARAYLHSNCAHCHLPGGPAGTSMDLRFSTAFASTNTCNVVPSRTTLGLPDPRIIHPGNADNSVLFLRMTDDTGVSRMAPLGTSLIDAEAETVLESWITGMTACP